MHHILCVNKLGFYVEQETRTVIAKLISAFVFATRIVQLLFFLNPKFQASTGQFVSDLVGNPEYRFSRVAAQIVLFLGRRYTTIKKLKFLVLSGPSHYGYYVCDMILQKISHL